MVTPNGPAASGAGGGPVVMPQMSASCPANVKEEREMMQACEYELRRVPCCPLSTCTFPHQ